MKLDFAKMGDDLVAALYSRRDPVRAVPMAAYMKHRFAFLGIGKPERAELARVFLRAAKKGETDWAFIKRLWALPEREFQYLAVDYLQVFEGRFDAGFHLELADLITSKAWWDTVDSLASVAGAWVRAYPPGAVRMLQWAAGPDLWLARVAILFQLKYREKTDAALLTRVIELNAGSREFFITKAIGWALREYSKTDPAWVRQFLAEHQLANLSVREASKYI